MSVLIIKQQFPLKTFPTSRLSHARHVCVVCVCVYLCVLPVKSFLHKFPACRFRRTINTFTLFNLYLQQRQAATYKIKSVKGKLWHQIEDAQLAATGDGVELVASTANTLLLYHILPRVPLIDTATDIYKYIYI